MSQEAYWIWLQRGVGVGNNTARIIREIPDIETFYNNGPDYWAATQLFSHKQLDRLCAFSLEKAGETVELCNANNWKILTPDMESFPYLLLQIKDCPLVLYVDGDYEIFNDQLCMSFVGTRSATVYGIDITSRLCAALAKCNIAIVSGGAMGIDSAAHRGALSVDGKTVLVLGCGLGFDYLKVNKNLRDEISKKGALVTEYPPNYPARGENFLVRNRIISALSVGTAVIEPGIKSGSLNTANHAFNQGRKVFVIPGNILDTDQSGLSSLIDKGAHIVFSPADLISQFIDEYSYMIKTENIPTNILAPVLDPFDVPTKLNHSTEVHINNPAEYTTSAKKAPAETRVIDTTQLSDDELKIFNALSDGAKGADEIVELTGFAFPQISPLLLRLQLIGIVSKTTDNKFTLK